MQDLISQEVFTPVWVYLVPIVSVVLVNIGKDIKNKTPVHTVVDIVTELFWGLLYGGVYWLIFLTICTTNPWVGYSHLFVQSLFVLFVTIFSLKQWYEAEAY